VVDRIVVCLRADDPISRAGVASQLRPRPEIRLQEEGEETAAAVVVVVVETIDEESLRILRHIRRTTAARMALIATRIDDQQLVGAAECGVAGILRRSEATPERLVQVINAVARGEGCVPADLLGRLLEQVGQLQSQVLAPRGLNFSGLTDREIEVVRLVAEGYDTGDIASKLAYSERIIKNILHELVTRLHLRNRSHVVAYALRQGLI
jgi:DNA-binding NarL/FixJ family response regulator